MNKETQYIVILTKAQLDFLKSQYTGYTEDHFFKNDEPNLDFFKAIETSLNMAWPQKEPPFNFTSYVAAELAGNIIHKKIDKEIQTAIFGSNTDDKSLGFDSEDSLSILRYGDSKNNKPS